MVGIIPLRETKEPKPTLRFILSQAFISSNSEGIQIKKPLRFFAPLREKNGGGGSRQGAKNRKGMNQNGITEEGGKIKDRVISSRETKKPKLYFRRFRNVKWY